MTRLTKSQFIQKFESAKMKAFRIFFDASPYETGYLRSMILLVEIENGFQIVIDVPYMEYTEEKWNSSSGAKNPNEGWFRQAVINAFNMIVEEMNI